MIPVVRPNAVPADLSGPGARQTALDCVAYDGDPGSYRSGAKKLPKRDYYSRPAVKRALLTAYRRKCCYCETHLPDAANLHVEHYRPKGGVRQARSDAADELPGYYWLAYTWTNLLLACHGCNSTCKGTLFPLGDPGRRARTHADPIAREAPMLVDPASEDPRQHIRFVDDAPASLTDRGQETIAVIGLDRPPLREQRLKVLKQLRAEVNIFHVAADHADPEVQALGAEALDRLHAAIQPDAPFSGMATDFLMDAL